MVTQTNTKYDLLVLCQLCEQRPIFYTTKSRDLLYPHEKCLCVPTTNPLLSLKFAFTLKTSDRGCNLCGRLGKDFRKLKITLVSMTYPGQRPRCPSLSPHVLLILSFFKGGRVSTKRWLNRAFVIDIPILLVGYYRATKPNREILASGWFRGMQAYGQESILFGGSRK